MKLKVQRRRDVWVRALFKREPDIEPDRLATGLVRTPVGRLHNPRPTPRSHNKPLPARWNLHRPIRQQVRELSRIFVVARHFYSRCILRVNQPGQRMLCIFTAVDARRSKEDNRILNQLMPEACQRFQIFRDNAN
jgi:hypothetical protein